MSQQGRYRFGKALRLRRRREFLVVQRQGIRRRGTYMTVIARIRADQPESPTRLGITASRRVGCAVVRNRVKRLVREAYRVSRDRFPKGLDVVVVALPRAREATLDGVTRDLDAAAASLGKRLGAGRR